MTVKDSEIWQRIKPFAMRDIGDLIGMVGGSGSAGEEYAIILFDKSALAMSAYSCSDDGMAGAIGAAASGDVIWVPPVTLADGYTIPSGVTVYGSGQKTTLNGAITNNGELVGCLIGGTLNNVFPGHAVNVGTATTSGILYSTNSNIADGMEGSVICGGEDHDLNGYYGFIGGGLQNLIDTGAVRSFIGGGSYGVVKSPYGVIGGGTENEISDDASSYSSIVGGHDNNISDSLYSAIAGGDGNILDTGADDSFIGAGYQNKIQDNDAVIGGGDSNLIKVGGNYAGILAGDGNTIGDGATASNDSAIVAGSANTVIGYNSIIPAGEANLINGANNAFAQGRRAHIGAGHHGAVLFADNTDADVNSAAANEFAVRATGGFRFLPKIGVGAVVVGINTTGQITSDLAIGTAPLTVVSTTVVTNLNADTVDGKHAADFALVGALHDAVTLDLDAAVLLDLSGQEIGLDTQNANTIFAGPAAGVANEPTFRALVAADLGSGAPDGTKFLRDDLSWQVPAGGGNVATDAIWDALGDLAVGTGANTAAKLTAGSDGQVLSADDGEATGLKWIDLPAAGAHDLLSATHSDTAADAVTRGSLIVGNSTPKWDELVKGTAGAVLTCDADDVAWSTFYLAGSAGHTYTFPDTTGTVALIDYDNIGDFTITKPGTPYATLNIKTTLAGKKSNIAIKPSCDDEGDEGTFTGTLSPSGFTANQNYYLPDASGVICVGSAIRYSVLVGGLGGVISYIGDVGTSGAVLKSAGVGANPAWSTFLLTGTAGGTTNFAITNTKTLTLTAADNYNITFPNSMSFPADAHGYLHDDGAGALSWAAQTGDISTDTLWDAKGDLAVGTGANTASKLTVGDNGTLPVAASGEATGIKWDMPFYPCDGRLTLTSGTPVTTADVTAATTLYFTPYKGNAITLYDGSNWRLYNFTEKSLSLVGYTASKPYDVFIYDNAGTLTMESLVWTNTTTRATALAFQDGVYVKSGSTTRRYLGTIYINSSGGQTDDKDAARLVWNYYNRVIKMTLYTDGTGHSYATATWRYWNNSGSATLQYICGVIEDIRHLDTIWYKSPTAAVYAYNGMSEDRVEGDLCTNFCYDAGHVIIMEYGSSMTNLPLLGYHYISVCEYSSGATTTFSYVRASMSMPM